MIINEAITCNQNTHTDIQEIPRSSKGVRTSYRGTNGHIPRKRREKVRAEVRTNETTLLPVVPTARARIKKEKNN